MPPRTPLRPISSNIQRNNERSLYMRPIIIGRHQAGKSPTEIHTRTTIIYTLHKDASRRESKPLPRCRHPQALSDRDERLILWIIREISRLPIASFRTETNIAVCQDTLYRRLKRHGIKNWLAKKTTLFVYGACQEALIMDRDLLIGVRENSIPWSMDFEFLVGRWRVGDFCGVTVDRPVMSRPVPNGYTER